jgi:hypothetical protein
MEFLFVFGKGHRHREEEDWATALRTVFLPHSSPSFYVTCFPTIGLLFYPVDGGTGCYATLPHGITLLKTLIFRISLCYVV